MHTVFINTSDKCPMTFYRELLFEKPLEEYLLMIPADHVKRENMCAFAQQLAQLIDQETYFRENIRLLVYCDSKAFFAESDVDNSAAMVAWQELVSLQMEYDLIHTLLKNGKIPGEVLFVFGEPTERCVYPEDAAYRAALNRHLWYGAALPDSEKTAAFLNDHPQVDMEALCRFLMSEKCQDKVLSDANPCFALVVEWLGQILFDNHQKLLLNGKWTGEMVMEKLPWAVSAAKDVCTVETLKRNCRVKIQYAYFHFAQADVKEKNRSWARLMLGVDACARGEDSFVRNLLGENTVNIPAADKPENAFCWPCVAEDVLAEEMEKQLFFCQHKNYAKPEVPLTLSQSLETELAEGEALIYPESAKCVPEAYVRLQKMSRRIRVKKLEEQVNHKLNEIEEKNKTINDQIRSYLNIATIEYDNIKAGELSRVPVTQEDYERFTGVLKDESSVDLRISNLQNMQETVERMQKNAELNMMEFTGRITTARSVERNLQNVHNLTSAYLAALKRSLLLLCMGFVFVVMFLVPYAAIKWDVFHSSTGLMVFGATAAAAVLMLFLGRTYFSWKYKNRVYSQVNGLVNEFNQAQMENQECLNKYRDFMYNKVPRCYGLSRYAEILNAFHKRMQLRKEMITFHEVALQKRAENIRSWLEGMDIVRGRYAADTEKVPVLDPELGPTDNEAYYVLSKEAVRSVLKPGTEENQ